MKKTIRQLVLFIMLLIPMGTMAKDLYCYYTNSNKTLTFYYDTERSLREGITFGLEPGWDESILEWSDYSSIEHVVFDSSFGGARPATTAYWFSWKQNLTDVTGLEYLHTDSVTRMDQMFYNCSKLTQLDLSAWNTEQLTSTWQMLISLSCIRQTAGSSRRSARDSRSISRSSR